VHHHGDKEYQPLVGDGDSEEVHTRNLLRAEKRPFETSSKPTWSWIAYNRSS
jgi:hypothetical protein